MRKIGTNTATASRRTFRKPKSPTSEGNDRFDATPIDHQWIIAALSPGHFPLSSAFAPRMRSMQPDRMRLAPHFLLEEIEKQLCDIESGGNIVAAVDNAIQYDRGGGAGLRTFDFDQLRLLAGKR